MAGRPLSYEAFYRELVERFFDSNSYFYHCIKNELDVVLNEVQAGNKKEYLILGHLFDALVSKGETAATIEKLLAIPGFEEFGDKLTQGIRFLYDTRLDAERMKIEIESLAHSMFNSVLLAFQHPNTLSELKRLLNLSGEPECSGSVGREATPDHDDEDEVEDEGEGEDELVASEMPDYKNGNLSEHPFEEKSESANELERADSGHSEHATEPFRHDDSERMLQELRHEPQVVVKYFCEEVNKQLDALEGVSEELAKDPDSANPEIWKRTDEIIDSVVMTSVIYGFEAFEEITSKAAKLISRTRDEENGCERAFIIIKKATQMLRRFLDGNPEHIESRLVKQFTARLNTPSPASDSAKPAEVDAGAPTAAPPASESEVQANDTTKASAEQPEQTEKAFKLPGEDDDEVMSLIAEIRNERKKIQDPAAEHDNEESQKFAADNSFLEESVPWRNSPAPAENAMQNYRRNAELYLSVIRDALTLLESQRQNKRALEDLELAANALYGLSLKLNLTAIGKLPDLLLGLIKEVLATGYAMSDADIELIRQAVDQFGELRNEDRTNSDDFLQVLKSVEELSARIKGNLCRDYAEQFPPAAIALK